MHVYESAQALQALYFAATWAGGVVPIYPDGRSLPTRWAERGEALIGHALSLDERGHEAALGLPHPHRNNGGPTCSTLLWAWIEGTDQVKRARAFRPSPAIVLKLNGSKRLLLWLLARPIPLMFTERANKRIAHALKATQTLAAAETLRVPLPGTHLRLNRVKPVPVEVTRLTLDEYRAKDVVGHLREPPPPWSQWAKR